MHNQREEIMNFGSLPYYNSRYCIMESIYIKNFGPLKEVNIPNVKKVTVFIGDSGSGKSTIMKVISLFRWLYKMMNIRSFLKYSQVPKCPFRFKFVSLLKNNGLADYLRPDSELVYKNGSLELSWEPEKKKLKGTTTFIPKDELSLEKISFISDKRNLISDIVDNNMSLKKGMYYLSETYSDFEMATSEVKELSIADLGIKFVIKRTSQGNKYLIVPSDGSESYGLKLNTSSSGTQNLVPMNVIVEYYSKHYDLVSSINKAILSYVSKSDSLSDFKAVKNIGEFANKNVHLIIEEPELSLFPSSQLKLVDFLVRNISDQNERDYKISLMFATHSPYIINYLNVILLRKRKTECGPTVSINDDEIAAYRVYDGTIQNLVCKTNEGDVYINTADLSEDMEYIYQECTSLTADAR